MQLTSVCLSPILPIETWVKQIKNPIILLPTNNLRILKRPVKDGYKYFSAIFSGKME
jgi:hypothetical protein